MALNFNKNQEKKKFLQHKDIQNHFLDVIKYNLVYLLNYFLIITHKV